MSIASIKDQQKKIIVILVLVMLVLAVYWQVQNFEFINYDDNLYVTQNYLTQSGLTYHGIIKAFADTHTGNWHPLTMLSHMLDWQLFGTKACGHHWTSVIIHIFNAILLFLLFKTMTGALWRSAFIAALFAIHPINLESVAWIAERKNVLSTFFWILTMLCYVWYVKVPGWKRYLIVFFCFVLGLMTKAMLVTIPFVLLLMDFWPLNRMTVHDQQESSITPFPVKKVKTSFLILEKIPFLMMAALFVWITVYAQKTVNAFSNPEVLPLFNRVTNAIVSYCLYMKKLFWPTDLAIFYPFNPISVWKVSLAALFIIFVTIVACKYFKKYPYLIVGWFWYLGTMIPVIGLIQVGRQSMADRYAYVPLIGLFVMVAWTIPQISSKLRHGKIYISLTFIIFIIIMTVSSYARISIWQNTTTLFENALRINPKNYFAYNLLGLEEADQGHHEKALQYYHMSLKMNPNNDQAYNNAGNVFLMLGKYQDAYSCYQKAILINDKQAMAYHNLGVLFALNNKADQAIIYFKKSLAIMPDYSNAHISMGITLFSMGNIKDAIYHYNRALNLNPNSIAARKGLNDCLEMQKDH
jgi:tetratricopeptide (TPR) repeat protein